MINKDKNNCLAEISRDLLYMIALFRQKRYEVKTNHLHDSLLNQIENFTDLMTKAGFSISQIDSLKYLICAALDEAHLNSINSSEQNISQSLISYYYNEEFSGDNFFQILDNLSNNEAENLPLIRVAYTILCLGFAGKYAIKPDGRKTLKEIKEKLHLLLIKHNNPPFLFIQDIVIKSRKFFETSEFRVIGLVIFLLFGIYCSLRYNLINKSSELYELILSTCVQNF